MKRRALLSLAATASLGGCFGIGRGPRSRLAWIRLENERDETHEVEVIVEDGDEQVFEDAYQLGTASATETARVDARVDGPGRYVVRFEADGQTVHIDLGEYVDGEADCIGVEFSVHEEGTLGYRTETTRTC